MYNNQFGYSPYYQQSLQPFAGNLQGNTTTTNTLQNSLTLNRQVLNGKVIDNLKVAEVIEFPLDGSTSYFPLADGSAIVSKCLLKDGTSKTVVYKPVEMPKEEQINYATHEELENLKKDIEDIKQELKASKKGVK